MASGSRLSLSMHILTKTPRIVALLVASLTWLVYAATLTAKYLFPQLGGSLTQLIQPVA